MTRQFVCVVVAALVCAVSAADVAACPGSNPVLVSPGNNAQVSFGIVNLNWNAVSGATSYKVWVALDGGNPSVIETTAFTQKAISVEPGRTVQWKIEATAPSCSSTTSPIFNFTTSCPTGAPHITGPSQSDRFDVGKPITFNWTGMAGATSYDVQVTPDFGATFQTIASNLNATSFTTSSLGSGDWGWTVRANFDGQCGPFYSEPSSFHVGTAACPTAPPQLVSPANNSVPGTQRVIFKWSAVSNAAGYELWVDTGAGDDAFALWGTTDGKTTELERFVPNDVVNWYVVARFSGCPSLRSTTFHFGARTTCNLATPTLASPANNAEVTSPVTLTWNAVQGATEYRITLKAGDTALVSRTTSTSISSRLPAGTFTWRVEALQGDCSSESSERTFVIKAGTNCANNAAPALVSPVGTEANPTKVNAPVVLQWSAAANAIAYRVWIARDGQPFQDVALTTQTSTRLDLEDDGRYAWFVQSIFEGCDAKRSATAYFLLEDAAGCTTTAPAVIAPAAGQTVTGRVQFQWGAVPSAEKYRVILLVNGQPVLLGTTTETQLERILEPGDYTYSVEAVFENCRSTFSPRTGFKVGRSQSCTTDKPAIVSPANGSTVTDPEVTLVWSPVSGAIKYAVLARVDDGTETLIGTTENTTLTHLAPPGEITWRVVAFFAGCDSQSSPRATFNVAPPQASCIDRKPVLLFPNGARPVPSPVQFTWLGVPRATEYRVWIQTGDERPSVAATTTQTFAEVNVPQGPWRWFVEARFASCPATFSARGEFIAAAAASCGTPKKPDAQVVGRALSNTSYNLRWMPLAQVARYEVQESTSLDFSNAQTFLTAAPFLSFTHAVSGAPVQYLYRVRGLSACSDTPGPYSDVVGVYVVDAKTNSATTELGGAAETVVQRLFVRGGTTPVQFTAKADKPWLMVTPSSGTLPVDGLTLTVTADPSALNLGTNTGTVQLTYASAARGGGIGTNDGPSQSSFPMSVSLVTPVMPEGKGTPPPDALIFPAVGHASGANDSLFESDTRLTNLTARTMKYDLFFTPSGTDGTDSGASTTIEVSPNETVALDDVVANMFGVEGSAIGMLEVRPIGTSDTSGDFFGSITTSAVKQLQTAASSRTYNFTPNGTFGQFIPAIPFARFVGRDAILSLQQVAQSNQFRANFGFLEASGNPVELIVRVFDSANTLLTSFPLSLGAMEHRQYNGLLQQYGIRDLADGRVEVEVTAGDGKVSAYVSEVDNATNDPLMVSPVIKGATRANRYVVPGMASLRSGSAFWVSDLRIFNGGTTSTPATLTFYPMGNPDGAISRAVTLDAGEIEVLSNVLVNLFNISGDMGGSIVITTPAETSLTATARTYNQTSLGTYGQFIPGVTVAESIGNGDRALQILQVEQSSRFRTNIGLNETSGKPVVVEVSLITPDSFVTPVVTVGLAANEFRQLGLIDFQPDGAVYNGRVTVKVIEGDGKVTAYGSAIDAITQDPTYVPAQ